MLAALLVEPGRIVIDDVPEPPIEHGEVRVAVGGVGLCGSDLPPSSAGNGRHRGTRG